MAESPAPTSLYATRWEPFLATAVFSGGLLVDLLYYFVWPTPALTAHLWEYEEPAKTILFIVVLLICMILVMLGLYWTLTPRPLLRISVTDLVYRPFPLPTRVIQWDDVEHVVTSAARQNTSLVTRATIFTIWFTFKPDHLSAASISRAQQPLQLQLDINLGTLSLRADELLTFMRTYHEVQWLQLPGDVKARKASRRKRRALQEQ